MWHTVFFFLTFGLYKIGVLGIPFPSSLAFVRDSGSAEQSLQYRALQ